MYWGNSLLGLIDTIAGLADMIKEGLYHAGAFLWSIFYHIWHLIAWIVSGVEGVFRNLAGIGSTNTDMVSVIINNSKVQQIFGNLIGLSIALIVFFTIVKIIQEHYKEKDGGNPYKVVLRTFQGLLMFFFVSAAVSVGVYASQIMFKALDAATGSGSSSVAGQIFKAMAADANRKKIGVVTSGLTADARNKYYYRLTDGTDATNGRYFVTTMTGNAVSSQSELAAAYADAFPYWQYEVVNADGSTTPIVNWLNSQGYSLDTQAFESYTGKSKSEIQEFENGNAAASVGYSNDLLRSVDLEVTPSIDLTWSPIDIDDFGYYLKETNKIQHDVNVTVWGTGINIGMSTQFGKYFTSGEKVQKSLEDSAKVFGISANGKVALQNGEALASTSLEMFDPNQFNDILKTIMLNVVFTNVFERMIQAIPSFPMEESIGPVAINFASIFGNVVSVIVNDLVEGTLGSMIPKDEDGNLTATPFLAGATGYNGGIWTTMNTDSRTLDIAIEQYRIDGNFTDLWGQLMSTYRDFLAMLEEEAGTAYEHALEQMDEIKNMSDRINQQQDMLSYKAKVDEYNKIAIGKLTTLGNMLYLWDLTQSDSSGMFDKDSFISARGYNGSFSKLEEDIKSTWTNLVSAYNSMIDGQKPTNMYADPRITYPVYKPIVEFNMTDKQATSSYFTGDDGVAGIRKALANNADSGIGSVVTNLLIDDRGVLSSTPSVYRMVDWAAYGVQYRSSNLKNYADIYATSEYINSLSSDAKGKVLLNNPSIVKLAYGSMETTDYTNWDERGGILNLVSSSQVSDNSENSFYTHSTSAGAQVSYALKDNGYWATDGIHVDNDLYEFYYEGTTNLGTFSDYNSQFSSSSTGSVTPANTVRTSSANENASMSAFAEDQSELHELLTMNTDSELANKFAQNIVKFHKIGTAADEEINVLKTWVGTKPSCKPLAEHTETMLTTMDADAIDDLMASGTSTSRQYIMLTKENTTDATNTKNWGEYVGRASWTDSSAVKALYEFGEMNYMMGFIAIITAVGVYLNFTFGLIQRAVNMAVLYIMSPVTIAFYPFDNGQRFKSSFVQPFYKEAISAYAVIISLNLFIVLMAPVRTAAATAVGGGVTGSFVGFLALVAFISMLPKIRDSICSILGAGSMSSQSLTDTFNNAKKSLGSAVGDIANLGKAGKNAAKKAAHGVDKLAQWKARNDIRKNDRQKKQLADLQAKAATGDLGWWGERRLNKLTKGAAAAESQKRIDEALATGDKSKLNKKELKRYNRQNNAADKAAEAYMAKHHPNVKEGTDEYARLLNQKRGELLKDEKFKKNVGYSVLEKAGTKAADIAEKGGKLVAAPAKLLGKGAGLAGRGITAGAKALADTGFGRTVRDMASNVVDSVGNTIVGDAISQTFGKYGTKASDKDSLWGAGMRLFARPDVAKKRLKEEQVKWIKEQQMENDANGPAQKGLSELATGMATKNRKVHAEAVRQAAAETLKSSKVSVADKAMALKASEYMRQGKNAEEAKTMAEAYYKDEYIKQAMAGKSDKEIYMAMQTEYRRKNDKMSAKDAKAQAEKDYNGIMSNKNGADELKTWINNLSGEYREAAFGKNFAKDSDFMAAEFTKMGGDGKLIAGMTKGMSGLASFGINFDLNSDDTKKTIKAASEKINNLVASGSNSIKLNLDTQIQKRQEDLDQSTKAIASGLGLSKDEDIEKVENVLRSANLNTTQTDIANQIAAKLHLDQNKVAKHVAAAYPDFAQNVQFNNEVQEKQAAFDAASALEKGKREFASKMGPNVNQAEQKQLIDAMMHIYDGDLSSTDPNSLGYQKNKIIQEEFHGDINNPACQAKLNDLQNKMYKAASVMFDDFVAKNRFNIIEHDVLQKSSQESSSVYSMSMVKEWEKQMEVSATLNLDTQSIGLMFKDNLLKEMKEQGNYTNVGTTIQLAVDSIMKGDEPALAKLSLEPGSIEQLKQWYAEGDRGIQRLEGLRNYAEFISTHTSNADMGGYDFNAMGAVMSKMLSALEQKIWVERTQSVARAWGEDEARDRFAVDSMMKQFNTLLNAPHWEALCNNIHGVDGKSPTNTEELKATMSSLLSAANNGTNSLEVQNALEKISNVRSQHVGDPAIYEEITRVMNAFASADAANWKSGNVNAVRDLASDINANIARTLVDDQSKLDQDYTK